MRRTYLLILVVVAAACSKDKAATYDTSQSTPSTAAAPADDAASRAAIDSLRSGWKTAADKKDAAAIAGYYTDDAVLVTSESPAANGKAAIQATLAQMLNAVTTTSIDSKDMVVAGNDAYDYGTFSQEVKAQNGKTSTSTGYYIVSLKKQSDGSWKIYRHVSTTPPVPK